MTDLFGEVIASYSRAQALEDGMLVDVSTVAEEAGIRIPVAMTAGVHAECVAWTRTAGLQDESGRLWDVIFMLAMAMRRAANTDRLTYTVLRVPNTGRGLTPKPIKLVAMIGAGDDGEPVLTILLPGED